MARELSMATREAAFNMALDRTGWRVGRSKLTGEPFWIIPSRSEPNVAHWVAMDARGCTCKGNRRNGDCCHAEAVRFVNAGQLTNPIIRQQGTDQYKRVHGLCEQRGCMEDQLVNHNYCQRHQLVDAF